MELLAGRQPAHLLPSFEHEHLAPALAEKGCSGEAVVAGADDDDVVGLAHSSLDWRTAAAASCPGAPMIPPPGWAPEPHIQRFLIGVL